MSQILDPIPNAVRTSVLCCYVNATNQIQVARITNIKNWYFERVVFPGQRLVFEAVPEALLEIHSGMMASAILSDTIPCQRLCINEDNNSLCINEDNNKEERKSNNPKDPKNNNKAQDVPVLHQENREVEDVKTVTREFSETLQKKTAARSPIVATV